MGSRKEKWERGGEGEGDGVFAGTLEGPTDTAKNIRREKEEKGRSKIQKGGQ